MEFPGVDFWIYFRIQLFTWFDSGYIYLPVFGGLGSDPAIDSRPALFVPVFSALLGSTVDTCFSSIYEEILIFLSELVDYGS